jgi:hypothetical protein
MVHLVPRDAPNGSRHRSFCTCGGYAVWLWDGPPAGDTLVVEEATCPIWLRYRRRQLALLPAAIEVRR